MMISGREQLGCSAVRGATLADGGALWGLSGGAVAHAGARGYGALVADPCGILDLPAGFTYQVLVDWGNGHGAGFMTYDDGQRVAGEADGSAAFAIGGDRTVIVTNHELSPGEATERVPVTFHGDRVPTYDPGAAGGTSNIVLDAENRVASVYPSLAGTSDNCGGGPTPWGTWLTGEKSSSFLTKQHGYVFEVDPGGRLTTAEPYRAMGRFNHEAVAIDPATSIAYLTEDSRTGLFYRFVPNDTSMQYGSLGNGGALSAMKAEGLTRLGEVRTIGTTVNVSWTAIANPDRAGLDHTLDDATVTRSPKLERIWCQDGTIYFASSYDWIPGIEPVGQIWSLDASADQIKLVAYLPTRTPTSDRPDSFTVSPGGQLISDVDIAGEHYLIGLEPSTGDLWAFARSATGENEFAGADFAPDGTTLYINIQNPATTLAITGPWGATGKNS